MLFSAFRQTGTPDYLVAGLGNPGEDYTVTRHNAGFLAMEYLSQLLKAPVNRLRFHALIGNAVIGGKRVLLMMPQTYMNLSGDAVGEAARFYRIPPERVIVIYDDKDIPVGHLRVRGKGSDGGHNGIKSIISRLGSENFPRIRIGIGKAAYPDMPLADHVLGRFTEEEQKQIFEVLGYVAQGVELIVTDGVYAAQNKLNGIGK
jgi:PTH1 family peptidyl-tRNA hydrolase